MSQFSARQIGALIRLEINDDPTYLVDATVLEIHCKTPRSDVIVVWTAQLDVSDGAKITYSTTTADDLPTDGTYKLQAHAEGPGWSLSGEIATMQVHKTLI